MTLGQAAALVEEESMATVDRIAREDRRRSEAVVSDRAVSKPCAPTMQDALAGSASLVAYAAADVAGTIAYCPMFPRRDGKALEGSVAHPVLLALFLMTREETLFGGWGDPVS